MHGLTIDRAGQRHGRLTVLRKAVDSRSGVHWVCLCDCGQETVAAARLLGRGTVRSCGCLAIEILRRNRLTHGATADRKHTAEYGIWASMVSRCTSKTSHAYDRYGGRGISVCAEWADAFSAFLRDMGPRPPGLTLERKDNDGDYSPENCRWATRLEQARNKRNNLLITIGGCTATLSSWAVSAGLNASTIRSRFLSGWPLDRLLLQPRSTRC